MTNVSLMYRSLAVFSLIWFDSKGSARECSFLLAEDSVPGRRPNLMVTIDSASRFE